MNTQSEVYMKPIKFTQDEIAWRRRMQDFPERLIQIGHNNPVINRIVQEYAAGHILFMDEALAQMVVHLAENWSEVQRRSYESVMQTFKVPTTP